MKSVRSLKNVLTFSFIIVAVLPIIAIGLLSMKSMRSGLRDEISRKNLILARAVAVELELFVSEPFTLLEHSKKLIENEQLIASDQVEEYLSTLVTNCRYFKMIKLLDHKGTVTHLSPYDRNIQGIDLSRQDYFFRVKERDAPFWSPTFISPYSGTPTLSISLPCLDGVLVGDLDLSYLNKAVDRVNLGIRGHILITDSVGTIIAHPDKELIYQRFNIESIPTIPENTFKEERNFRYRYKGEEMLCTQTTVSHTNWHVVVSQPVEEAFIHIRWNLLIILSGSLAAIALALIIAFSSLRNILKPLIELTERSKQIAAGDYSCHMQSKSYNELNNLTKGFQVMTEAIQSREDEIKKTKGYLKNIIDSISSAIIAVDSNLRVTQYNSKMKEMLKLDDRTSLLSPFTKLSGTFIPYELQIRGVLEDKKERYFHKIGFEELQGRVFDISMYPLLTENREGVVIRFDDITEKEMVERQLTQAQKMETVGTLAGGLAHDFNNILVGVVTTTSLMELELDAESLSIESLSENIKLIKQSGQRAAGIVKQLLTLSRKNRISLEKINLKESIANVLKLCANSFDKSITIKTELLDKPAYIKADPNQLEQMLLNLCVNASHAMTIMREREEEYGGILSIQLGEIDIDKNFCRLHPHASAGKYFALKVSDTGVGIAPESLARIFEPFYTNKKESKGTGLGLAMSYNIISEHKGFITTESKPKVGTTFSIYLPRLNYNLSNSEAPLPTRQELQKGSGLILIIDDEKTVRSLVARVVKNCGYTPITAANGVEGIEIFKEHSREIKLVILDMSMPQLSGKATFIKLKELKDDVRVLISSGFTEDERAREIMRLGCKQFIQKPYTVHKLAEFINKMLKEQ